MVALLHYNALQWCDLCTINVFRLLCLVLQCHIFTLQMIYAVQGLSVCISEGVCRAL